MFGRLSKSAEAQPAASPLGPLDRLGRRGGEGRADATAAPADREGRLAAAAASLPAVVGPRLRELIGNGVPPRQGARPARQQAQIHFRQNGVMLSPLELRGYVAEVLRPLLPAQNFSVPEPEAESEPVVPTPVAEIFTPVTEPSLADRKPEEPKSIVWDSPTPA